MRLEADRPCSSAAIAAEIMSWERGGSKRKKKEMKTRNEKRKVEKR